MSDSMTLAELAEAAGVPARTIRFYIARRILSGPEKAGRGAVYGPEHLKRLEEIQQLQSEGRTITEIGRTAEVAPAAPAGSLWWQYRVGDDVVISVREGLSPWRTRQVRAALEEFAGRLGPSTSTNPEPEEREENQ